MFAGLRSDRRSTRLLGMGRYTDPREGEKSKKLIETVAVVRVIHTWPRSHRQWIPRGQVAQPREPSARTSNPSCQSLSLGGNHWNIGQPWIRLDMPYFMAGFDVHLLRSPKRKIPVQKRAALKIWELQKRIGERDAGGRTHLLRKRKSSQLHIESCCSLCFCSKLSNGLMAENQSVTRKRHGCPAGSCWSWLSS